MTDTGRLYAIAQVAIESAGKDPKVVPTLVDTGFTEWLSLPPELIGELGLKLLDNEQLNFANAAAASVDVYEAVVFWCGQWHEIRIHELPNHPLLGMEMLRSGKLELFAQDGGEVMVEAIGNRRW